MQDYNYWRHGCLDVTVELTCCIFPRSDILKQLWLDNKKSLIEYAKFGIEHGVRGVIRYENGQPAKYVSVQIDEREPIMKTSEQGEFYRILLPNRKYNLRLMFDCANQIKVNGNDFVEVDLTDKSKKLIVLNLTLSDAYFTRSLQMKEVQSRSNYTIYCNYKHKPIDYENECKN